MHFKYDIAQKGRLNASEHGEVKELDIEDEKVQNDIKGYLRRYGNAKDNKVGGQPKLTTERDISTGFYKETRYIFESIAETEKRMD